VANIDELYRAYEDVERRLQEVEKQCPTPEEQEINRFLQRVVRSVRATLWLTNGAVKYFAAPLGIAFGLWAYGESAVDWLISKATGLPK
jgi:hypothetical protein